MTLSAEVFRDGRACSDDAFIIFRYAKNFFENKGLVFNEGEVVEGYTSLLYVLISALFYKFALTPWVAAKYLMWFCMALTIVLTYLFCRRIFNLSPYLSLLPPYLLSISFSVSITTVSIFETNLFTMLNLLALFIILRAGGKHYSHVVAGSIFGLAYLTRPEGTLVFFLTAATLIISGLKPKEGANHLSRKNISICVATFAAIFLSHLLFRYS